MTILYNKIKILSFKINNKFNFLQNYNFFFFRFNFKESKINCTMPNKREYDKGYYHSLLPIPQKFYLLCSFDCLEWEGQWGLQNVHPNFINTERKRYAPKRKGKKRDHIVEVIGCLQSKGSMRGSCSLAIAIPLHRQVGHITYINKEHD